MQLKRLQSFISILEKRSFTDAAEAVGLTPSALSKQIKSLEEELGVPLFYRNAAIVEPTAAGRLVYDRSKALLDDWTRLVSECRAFAAAPSGKLKIGVSTVPAAYLLPTVAKRLLETHPQLEFAVFENDSASILTRLEQRSIDVAIVGASRASSTLRFEPIAADTLAVVGATGATGGDTEDWTRKPFIQREEGSGTREALERALARLGRSEADLKVAAVCSSTESALALAEAGVGVTAVSRWALAAPRNVTVLAELPAERKFYAVYEAGREQDPLVRVFLDAARRLEQC
ncbi:LysR family transcriptional regulator [Paenibacillus sp. TRM 82003]|nr:LysR family transcriptional regulator [Paenibacillus sp. TRM 82003]